MHSTATDTLGATRKKCQAGNPCAETGHLLVPERHFFCRGYNGTATLFQGVVSLIFNNLTRDVRITTSDITCLLSYRLRLSNSLKVITKLTCSSTIPTGK